MGKDSIENPVYISCRSRVKIKIKARPSETASNGRVSGDGLSDIGIHREGDSSKAGTVAPLCRASSDQPARLGLLTTSWPQA